jgi:hypothetical protein
MELEIDMKASLGWMGARHLFAFESPEGMAAFSHG